jgi:sigma-E factor negative regulatory protein RseA
MSNKFSLEESLSALMDDEVDDLELRRILKELPEQANLNHTWERYHLISAMVKQEAHSRHSVDILTEVRSQIDGEQVNAPEHRSFMQSGLIKTAGQGAIAAAVTLLVLFTVDSITDPNSNVSGDFEIAATADIEASTTSPVFNGNYTASEFSRVASFDDTSEDVVKDRLTEAVYRELEERPEDVETQLDEESLIE